MIVADVLVETVVVPMVKVADVLPAGTTTATGTVAEALLEDKVIEAPPAGAGVVSLTVPVDDKPPLTADGETPRLWIPDAMIVKLADSVMSTNWAEIVTEVLLATPVVPIVNVALVAPVATVTVAGTVAATLFEERLTTEPPGGAGYVNVTFPVDGVPPDTVIGVTDTAERLVLKISQTMP